MHDVRIRTGSAILLSFAAFAGTTGAAAVLAWWLIFARPRALAARLPVVLPLILMIGFFSTVLQLAGGDGLSYGFRMIVIVLVGFWLQVEYRSGDFLDLGTWLLGNGIGFELGMTAELGVGALDQLLRDGERIRIALRLKGSRHRIRNLVPAGMILLWGALRRAEESREILSVRGYTRGGTLSPEFTAPARDIIAGAAAVCTGIIALVPVSEFFILYH